VKDGPLRAAVKRVARAHFELNLGLSRWLRGRRQPPLYTLGGTCGGCAACCEAPAIRASAPVWYLRSLRRAFLWWQERVNGFVLVQARPGTRLFVFRCTHFDARTRRCDSYATRPGLCRDYPRGLLEQPFPEFFPGCGYRAVAWNRERWERVLGEIALTDEQRRKIRAGLRLER
jgi:Fe-S-cluster containining protein